MDMIDSGFRGVAAMLMVVAFWVAYKIVVAIWRWLSRDAVRSLGRASGAVVSSGRKLGQEFKEGFKDKS